MRLLRSVAIILIAFCLLIGVAVSPRWFARLSDLPTAPAFSLASCGQPCWNLIRPGSTSIPEALNILNKDRSVKISSVDAGAVCWEFLAGSFARGCFYTWRSYGQNSDRIEIINLFPRDNSVRLGEMVLQLGSPIAMKALCGSASANIYFKGNVIAVLPPELTTIDWQTPVSYVSLVATQASWVGTQDVLGWHKFDMRLGRHC